MLVIESNRGTSTDFDGNFSIMATQGDVIEVSYIGYQTSTLKVDSRSNYNVTLALDAAVIDEVVVVGYGSGRAVSAITGSIRSEERRVGKEGGAEGAGWR